MDDCWSYIFTFVDRDTFHSISRVCKKFYQISQKDARFTNHLLILLRMFPDKPWNWYGISQNPNITWDIIVANPDKPWNRDGISQNPNITWDIIAANPDKPWNWYVISRNKFNRYLQK